MNDRAKLSAVILAFLALFGFLIFQAGVASRHQPSGPQSTAKRDSGNQSHVEPGSFRNWITHDAAGFFTAWLVIVGFGQAGLFVWQLRYMRIGMRDATVAANAARDSSAALVAAERARFFIVISGQNLTNLVDTANQNGRLTGGENIVITYQFKNYGKTPGVVRELVIDSMIATDPVDPQLHALVIKDFPEHMIAGGDATVPDNYSPLTFPDFSHIDAIGRNQARLWLFGRLYYDDVFGKPQTHRFYFRSVCLPGQTVILQPYDYKDYNKST
jgi:hypothetical protein